jgi:ketosteroid isomerase-like protein
MKCSLVVFCMCMVAMLVGAPKPTVAQTNDAIALWKSFEAATNNANADAAADKFADDGVFVDTHPSEGLSGLWRGKAQIREFLKLALHPGDRQESGDFLLNSSGNSGQLTINDVRQWFAPGVDLPPGLPVPVESRIHMTYRDGKITALVVDNKPDWLVRASVQGTDPGNETPEPLVVWNAFLEAANKPDAAAVTALFAEDGVFIDTHPSAGLTGVWYGKVELLELFEASFHPGDRWESSGYLVGAAGNKQQMTIEDVRDWLKPGPDLDPNVPLPVESRFHITVQDGRIKVLVNDNKPGWLARAGALGHPVSEPVNATVGMPRTGIGSNLEAYLFWGLLIGLILAIAGILISWRTSRPV